VLLAALVLTVVSQAETPAPTAPSAPAEVKVNIVSETSGVTLAERATKKVRCTSPCAQLLPSGEAEYVLSAPGVMDSDPFTLGTAAEVNVRWRAATMASRIGGAVLTITGFAAVLASIAIGLTAMILGISCSNSPAGCGDFRWAYSAIGLAGGGYVALGIGMTLMFRFGIEGLSVESVQPL
jgi:hypothetical protein